MVYSKWKTWYCSEQRTLLLHGSDVYSASGNILSSLVCHQILNATEWQEEDDFYKTLPWSSSYGIETVSNKSLVGSDTAFTCSGCFEWKKNPQPVCCVQHIVPPRLWRRAEQSAVQLEYSARFLEETTRATMTGPGRVVSSWCSHQNPVDAMTDVEQNAKWVC